MLRNNYAAFAAFVAVLSSSALGGLVLKAQESPDKPPASRIHTAPENTDVKPWRSALYPEDWKPGFRDSEGRFLHDFSYAGYHRGDVPLPVAPYHKNAVIIDVTQAPYLADKTGAADATEAIQKALDAAAQSKDGAVVLMPAGIYKIAPPEGKDVALRLTGDRVVFRGEGVDKTFLYTDTIKMRGKTLLRVRADAPLKPLEWGAEGPGVPSTLVTADLPNQAETIPVADTSQFAVGDTVVVRSDLTQRFIDELKMTDKWKPAAGLSPNRTLMFCRRITAVDAAAKTIRLDTPIRYPMKTADLARVVKIPGHAITESGLEDFSIGMKKHPGGSVPAETATTPPAKFGDEEDYNKPGTLGYDVHGSTAISISNAENCWMRRVNSYAPAGNTEDVHLLSNGFRLTRTRCVTVTDCDWKCTQYKGGGGNGYLYTVHGQENLLINCRAERARHNYSFGTMWSSGNVISKFYAKDGNLACDFHMFLSMSNLLDNITCEGDFLEARYYRPWGGNPIHGLTTTQSVFWNTNGLRYSKEKAVLVVSHQYGDGYVIGTRGPECRVDSSDFVEGIGLSAALVPQSLYADQLERRRKRDAGTGTGTAAAVAP